MQLDVGAKIKLNEKRTDIQMKTRLDLRQQSTGSYTVNTALILKLAWHVLSDSSKPWIVALKAKDLLPVLLLWERPEQQTCLTDFPLVEFEGDNLQVCNALCQSSFVPNWSIAIIIRDIKALLDFHSSWKVCHVKCGANMFAHNIANWAASENLVGNIPKHPSCYSEV
ncbi:hypothetical protein CJ030_MR0G006212 [Morella rubra]|uniref:Uncharacterized protein n=1 Tax=Morella rubra TaxID=262757 RepID=A0A6A1UKV3_9ROSI|nr:hypothetical protein CJ030_MR0G006212 [Morella rubra]